MTCEGFVETTVRTGRQPARPDEPAPIPAGDVDGEILDAVREVIGAERTARLLDGLAAQIDRCLSIEALLAGARDDLRRDAHAMVSSAGALGFVKLAELSGALEAACLSGPPPGLLLAEIDAAGRRALAAIERLRAA